MRYQSIAAGADTAGRWGVIALGFSLPISVALDNVLLAMILALWLVAGDFRNKLALLRRHRVAHAALTLFGILVIGLAWGEPEPGAGLRVLVKYADLALVPVFITLFQAERDRDHALLAFAAALVLTLILSYSTWAGLIPKGVLVMGDEATPEVFKKYLAHNILMAFGAFLFAHFALRAQSRRARVWWSVLAVLATVNVMLMLPGRTGQLILAVLAVYFAYSAWRWAGALLVTGGVAVVATVVVLGLAPADSRLNQVLEHWKAWQAGQASQTSTGQRLDYYQHSLEIIRGHPLAGVGTGGFAKAYASQVAGTDLIPTVNPHNEYLLIAVQVGLLGLTGLLYLFYRQWQVAGRLAQPLYRDLARGLVLTFVVGCLFNSLLLDHTEGLLFAWFTGLLFAAPVKPDSTTTARPAP
jgi:O-antigen ligase